MEIYDITIIGAGPVGMFAAFMQECAKLKQKSLTVYLNLVVN